MSGRRPPKQRVIIEELRFFLDQNYKDEFTNFQLTENLKFEQPIPDIMVIWCPWFQFCFNNIFPSDIE